MVLCLLMPPSQHCKHSSSSGDTRDFTLKELLFCFFQGLAYYYLHLETILCCFKKFTMDKREWQGEQLRQG